MRIALADHDPAAQADTTSRLRFLGAEIHAVANGQALLALVRSGWPDVVLLDVVLPDGSGLVVCGQLRARSDVPIVFYSASRRRDDPTLGRMLGADDFISKDADTFDLQARIRAVLRRSVTAPPTMSSDPPPLAPSVIVVDDLVVDLGRQQASLGGSRLALTRIEYRLLAALARRPGETVTRAELAEALWGPDRLAGSHPEGTDDDPADATLVRSRAIDMHVVKLRVKLRAGPVPAPRIVAERGAGYTLLPGEPPPGEGPGVMA